MLAMVSWGHIGFLRRSMSLTHGKPVNRETLMLNSFKGHTMKNNFFSTLSEALEAENLSHAWPCTPIAYGQTIGLTYDDGSKYGYYVSIYRDERGLYERPIHYKRG